MDLRAYFQKIRSIEAAIAEEFVVVVSSEGPDGGRNGQLTEVHRPVAAKLIVDGKARLAEAQEAEAFHAGIADAKRSAEASAMKDRGLTVIGAAELSMLKELLKKK